MIATLLTPRCLCTILPQHERAEMALDAGWRCYPLTRRVTGIEKRTRVPSPGALSTPNSPAELESPVPHGLPAYTGRGSFWVEPTSVVGHLDVGELTVETQLYRSTLTWPASACRRTFVSASWTRRVSSWPALSGSLAGKSSSTTSSTSYLPRAIRRFRSTRFSSEETTERSSVSLRRNSKMAPRSPSTDRLRNSAVASRARFRSPPRRPA